MQRKAVTTMPVKEPIFYFWPCCFSCLTQGWSLLLYAKLSQYLFSSRTFEEGHFSDCILLVQSSVAEVGN